MSDPNKLAGVLRDAAQNPHAGPSGLVTINKDWLLAAADALTAAPVAWRWRWSKLGSNTAWHLSLEKPGPFPEEGYEVEPLFARPSAAREAA